MKKQCKVLVLSRNPNNKILGEKGTLSSFNNERDIYLLSLENVYCDEWCFEKHEEYKSRCVRFLLNDKDSAWLRTLNMDCIVHSEGISLKMGEMFTEEEWNKIDWVKRKKDFENNFVNRLSETSNPYFNLSDVKVVKVIASTNRLLNGCLFIDFKDSLKTNDIVEITIENNKVVNLKKL